MRVLVTGGAGMVGSHCAEYFAKKGCEVVVLDNLMRSKLFGYDIKSVEYNWEYLAGFDNITRVKGDVRCDADVKKAIGGGVDACIHTAGQTGVPLSMRIPREDFNINAYGTLNVLEHLRTVCDDAVFVYTSTNKVYGENVNRFELVEGESRYRFKDIEGVSETLSVDDTGHTPYGASKYAGDMYVQEYHHLYGMKTGVFRMSCIYGIRQFGFEDQGWVSHFVISALLGRPVTIYGDGKQVRDLLYVSNLVSAFDKFIKAKNTRGGVFNIGGGPDNTISLKELVEYLSKRVSKMSCSYTGWRPSDQKVYVSDITRVCRELGWKPTVSVHDGVDRLIDWARENLSMF